MNVLKVFDDFRQLSFDDQEKIVEWFNENGKREVRVDKTPAKVIADSTRWRPAVTSYKPQAKKDGKQRIPFTKSQVKFIDLKLIEQCTIDSIADQCKKKWPSSKTHEAWKTMAYARKKELKEGGEL